MCFFKNKNTHILAYACENIISGWSVYLDIEGVNDVELSKKEILERARQYEEMKERKK